ncbi:MAG: gbsB [Planctomycetaceae bacterium]|nr:gbsB [Planctomycetaceae bacterium]
MLPNLPAYDFFAPSRIVFGWGRRVELGQHLRSLGRRVFLISGSRTLAQNGTLDTLCESLSAVGIETVRCGSISHEPEVADVDQLVVKLRAMQAGDGDIVLGIGGGSAIDLAKATAAIVTNNHGDSIRDLLEGVGKGLKIEKPPLPLVVLPTTSGTGSEATKNAVISSYDPPFKKSLRSDLMVPRLVLIDPELSVTVPPQVTAATGLDAITQLIESDISCRAKPIPQALALRGLEGVVPALRAAYHRPDDRPARELLAQSALLSGMALANSGLGVAHGIAAALGVHCRITHGLACAMLLPTAIRINSEVQQGELARVMTALTGRNWASPRAAIEAGLDLLSQLLDELKIPRHLADLGVKTDQFPAIVRSSHGNSLDGNPRPVSDGELLEILHTLY